MASLHDCMTQCRYLTSIESFDLDVRPEEVFDVDVTGEGRKALERTNKEMGEILIFKILILYIYI